MKVITEEDLYKEMRNLDNDDEIAVNDHIVPLLKEIDTLTVSKLRPMSDAILCNEPMAAYHIKENRMLQIEFDCLTGKWDTLIGQCDDSEFSGFELMIYYKPELTGDK